MRRLRRAAAVLFAGDRRVWVAAAVVSVPLVALIAFNCLRPRSYYTGTDNVEAYGYIARAPVGESVCVPGLQIPADTARIRLMLKSRARLRPVVKMTLSLGGRDIVSRLAAVRGPVNRINTVIFAIPELPDRPAERPASVCLTAAEEVNWAGTPLASLTSPISPTVGGRRLAGAIAVWYLPRARAQSSYLARAAEILRRASLFRPAVAGPWLYVLILLVVLPGLALASVRCLALAVASRGAQMSQRRLALLLFAIAALNFACWAFIIPPFQSPDEVDHFAYTQSLVERGEAPSRDPASPLKRWSGAETLVLNDMSFFSDRQVGDSRPPWTSRQERIYNGRAARLHPSSSNGGGHETAATHGAIYYAALVPAYLLASSSPLDQLTLMRLTSALIGALTVVFAFLLARELAPGRPWLAVLAALLVAYQPMYGSISGAVNNDVGVNAGTAALELLLIMIVRRGLTPRLGLLTAALALALPIVKGTAYSLYPVAGVVLVLTLWRHHRRSDARGWAGLAIGALVVGGLSSGLIGVFHRSVKDVATVPTQTGFVRESISQALMHPFGYLGYVWQVFLPRLPFMGRHFETGGIPAFAIFVERGWAAFGWYDVLFPHWVYVTILVAMLTVPMLGVLATRREWAFVRRSALELLVLSLMPIAVIAGFEAAFYTPGTRSIIPEFGRYAFPAIAPLSVLVVGSLHAFGRRRMVFVGAGLLVGMIALSYASQLLTLSAFYA